MRILVILQQLIGTNYKGEWITLQGENTVNMGTDLDDFVLVVGILILLPIALVFPIPVLLWNLEAHWFIVLLGGSVNTGLVVYLYSRWGFAQDLVGTFRDYLQMSR
ncbi:MAG: hypothetical protein ACXAE3_10595 [Candidatus Kariarchaeaceae archaeon]